MWNGLDSGADVLQAGQDGVLTAVGRFKFQSYSVWTEWYPGKTHTQNLTIHPGDQLYVETWIGDQSGNPTVAGTFGWFYICNDSTATCLVPYPSEPQTVGYPFTGNSAEWIMERPGDVPVSLADFATASMSSADVFDRNWSYHDANTDSGFLLSMVSQSTGHLLATATKDYSQQVFFNWVASY